MTSYSEIHFPFTSALREMTRIELRGYFDWFVGQVPIRITALAGAVKSTSNCEQWKPDLSPGSLDALHVWFGSQANMLPLSANETLVLRESLAFPTPVPTSTLSRHTLSLVADIGMYLGSTLIKNNEVLRWDQDLKSKRYADYGHVLVCGTGKVPLNPLRIVQTIAYSLCERSADTKTLGDMYEWWSTRLL